MNQPKVISLGGIYTDRHAPGHDHPSWHLVHEWEEGIAQGARISILDSRDRAEHKRGAFARALVRMPVVSTAWKALNSMLAVEVMSIHFTMTPQGASSLSAAPGVIPVIIDFWKTVSLRSFNRAYGGCPLVLISSLEALEFLKESGCPLNLRHFPLSLPDKYRLEPQVEFEKRFDVLIAGRTSPVLVEFMQRYAREHEDIEFVQRVEGGEELRYASNKGGPLGVIRDRQGYMDLLRASRVGLYSTPGIDGGEARTGGFNPVTPRLFELLAAGCHVLARYPDNADTAFFRMNGLCASIGSYAQFSDRLEAVLGQPAPTARNAEYLKEHYTSNRVNLLNTLIKDGA